MPGHFLRRQRRFALQESGSFPLLLMHPLATDWSNRVVTNGGTSPSANTVNAISTFLYTLDNNSLTSQMLVVNVIAPDSLTAALTPLIKTGCVDPWINHSFISGDLSINGIAGGGNKYCDLGVPSIPPSLFPNLTSAGISIYSSATSNPGTNNTFGCADSGFSNAFTMTMNQGSNTYFECWSAFSSLADWSQGGGRTGFFSGNRPSSTNINLYFANSTTPFGTVASGTGTAGGRPGYSQYCWAINFQGSPGAYGTDTFSFVSVHNGLSSVQSQTLYNAVQTLRTSLGGGFV